MNGAPNLLALPAWFHLGATFVFAVTGAIAAIRRHYDVVGVFALAFVTGVGGALLRDGLLIQKGPPVVLTDWRYLAAIATGCAVGYLFGSRLDRFNLAFSVIDALGLAAYGVIGARLSLAAGLSIPAAIFVGVVNAAGGGALRDILTREEPLMFKAGQFYVLATVSGTSLFVLLVSQLGFAVEAAAWWGVAATFVLRVLAIHYDWRTSPLRWETSGEPPGKFGEPRP